MFPFKYITFLIYIAISGFSVHLHKIPQYFANIVKNMNKLPILPFSSPNLYTDTMPLYIIFMLKLIAPDWAEEEIWNLSK